MLRLRRQVLLPLAAADVAAPPAVDLAVVEAAALAASLAPFLRSNPPWPAPLPPPWNMPRT
jgi:hypothetical protein